jgi:hypothetical protein
LRTTRHLQEQSRIVREAKELPAESKTAIGSKASSSLRIAAITTAIIGLIGAAVLAARHRPRR